MPADAGSDAQLPPDRAAALNAAKLTALVRSTFVPDLATVAEPVGDLAALVADEAAYVLIPGDATRRFGHVVLWASRQSITDLHVLGDDGIGVVARRAQALEVPPKVWAIEGTELVEAQPADWFVADAFAPNSPFAALFEQHGIDFELEHGVGIGRYRGLEIARVVLEPEPHIEVGIGRFDREAGAMLHQGRSDEAGLAAAVAEVAKYRRRGAEPHPIGRLARERWLRCQLVDEPALVGCVELHPLEPPIPDLNLKDPAPASARGSRADGSEVLIVASVGVDPEIVAVAADLLPRYELNEVVFVLPRRDILPPVERAAAQLAATVSFVGVDGEWSRPQIP